MFGRFLNRIMGRPRSRSQSNENTGHVLSPPSPDPRQRLSLQIDQFRSPSPADSELTTKSETPSRKGKDKDRHKRSKYLRSSSATGSEVKKSESQKREKERAGGEKGDIWNRDREGGYKAREDRDEWGCQGWEREKEDKGNRENKTKDKEEGNREKSEPDEKKKREYRLDGSRGITVDTHSRAISEPARQRLKVYEPKADPTYTAHESPGAPPPPVIVVSEHRSHSKTVPKTTAPSFDPIPPYETTAAYYRSQQLERLEAILDKELSPEERQCLPARGASTDVNSLVNDTLQSANDALLKVQQSRLVKGLTFDKLVKALSKVAQIGDIAIQHSPEFTALAWAGLRFLLQVAINDLETRENLESAMETITTALGTCAFYEAFYLSSTTEMVKKLAYAMPELYGAVIIFSIKARKWMDARNSGMRQLKGVFKPFEVYFQPLIDKIKEKAELVDNAAKLAGLEDNRNSMNHVKELLKELTNIMSDANKAGADVLTAQERKNLRDSRVWLGGLDIDQGYEKNNKKRTANTCTWFLKSPEYKNWLQGTFNGILWICGIPGAGKSVTASFIVETLKNETPTHPVLHYFFQHDFPKTASALTMAATITDQLLLENSSKEAVAHLVRKYENSKSSTCEDFTTIWAIFLELVGGLEVHQKPIYVVIDAVDECPTETREVFLEALCASEWIKLGVRFLVTSRQIADISMKLESNTQTPQALKLRLGIDFVQDDIKEFIEEQLEKPKYKDIRKHREIIKETIPRKAEGMFKYAVLLLETLNEPSDYNVTEILAMVPEGLDAIYAWILEHLDERTLAMRKKVFMWVMVSARAITLNEMGLACITRDGEEDFDPEQKRAFGEHQLHKACGPLVELGPKETVQFSHFTAKEFLQKKAAEKEYRSILVSKCIVDEHLAHVAVLTTCITQLLSPIFLKSKRNPKSVPYAVANWIHHAKQAQIGANATETTTKDSALWTLMKLFLDDKRSCFTEWKEILPVHMPELRGSCLSGNRQEIRSVTALHITATWGLTVATQGLLGDPEIDIEAKDSLYSQTPLSWAAEYGHTAVVEMLLHAGADIEARDAKYGRTPLLWGTINNHKGVVNALVKKGAQIEAADITWRNVPHMTPLLWAASESHTEILKILVDAGADTEAKDLNNNRTALIMVVMKGCMTTARYLLDHGAYIDAVDGDSRSSLSYAAELGSTQMVKLLLDRGADVHIKDNLFKSDPFLWETKEVPSEYALDDAEDELESALEEESTKSLAVMDWQAYGRTPLSYAAASGKSTAVVKMLLEKNVNVEAMDQADGRTPLSLSAEGGFVEVASLLVDNGADLEAKDTVYGYTPLSWAAGAGRLDMVKLLLNKGALMEPGENVSGTPLILAAGGGWTEVSKVLLDRGAKIETKDFFLDARRYPMLQRTGTLRF